MSLVLGIDTCGPVGSVALARLSSGAVELLGQKELPSRNYTATLISAVGELLAAASATAAQLEAIAVTSGPGSFTGVRVGLAAVKGLAEPAQTPIVAVSRLAVLAAKAGTVSSALDAHRHEIFLRAETTEAQPRELLAGAAELAELAPCAAR
ncbi:MAG TPA: tRNA (adenosine(37)-N6)-threonylcarbamoyltransferase complex dimerization subunit type 1 TsaB, partial [Terracidiphilus sp.]|nr:tRNA (adenosine(37)-N6)-threonylcarbamoyltransferase complex dimerization subunit type 1 TsaB [Terracidiphilus sp.]